MPIQDAIKRLQYQFTSTGADKVAGDMNKVGDAQAKVATTAATTERATLSAERRLESIQKRYDAAYRAQSQLQKIERDLNLARAQGLVSLDRQHELMRLAERQITGTAAANDNLSKATAAANLALGRIGISITPGLGVLGALGAALGVVAVSSTQAVNAYQKFEEEHLALNAVLAATGLSAGRTADDIEKLAADIGNLGEVRKAALELAQFRTIAGDVFDRTLRAADDLAAAGFGSISAAAAALGRALESPADGLTRLRRAGIFFSESQIATIKNMQETGRVADAQRFILAELEKRVGGVGAARDQGLAGSYEKLGDATKRLLEQWGRQISEGLRLTSVIRGIASLVDAAATPANPLADIDQRIGMARGTLDAVGGMGGSIAAQARRRAEAELNRLLAERAAIVAKVADEQARADRGAAAAAVERQAELIRGVVGELEKETAALKLNNYERAVDAAMRKAEASPGSAGEAEIQRAVSIKMQTEATEQATASIRAQIAQLELEAATYGMSASAALEYRIVQDAVNKAKERGITLSDENIEKIRAEAAVLGKRTQEFELQKNGLEELERYSKDFTKSFASGMLEGKSAADALAASMGNLSQQLLNAGVDNLVKGLISQNAVQAVFGAVEIGVAFLTKAFSENGEEAKRAAEELAQAQIAWRRMANEVQGFNEQSLGIVIGETTEKIRQAAQDYQRLAEAAEKAHDTASVKRLQQDYDALVTRTREQFRSLFDGIIEAINSGLGFDSPFVKAQQNIQNLADQLKAFVTDTQTVFSGAAHTGFGYTPLVGPLDASSQIRTAQEAAQAFLLMQLTGTKALSDVASKLLEIEGTAVELQNALVDLGMSAGDAAVAISEAVVVALNNLRQSFVDDLQRKINEATGQGFVNQFLDLFAQVEQARADAALLGTGADLVERFFGVSAQQIVDDVGLAGASFHDDIDVFTIEG